MLAVEQIQAKDAFEKLCINQNSVLIDIRTNEEFENIGIVDDKNFCNKSVLLPYLIGSEMNINPDFLPNLLFKIDQINDAKNKAELFFICRSGGRSNSAAEIIKQIGYKNIFNIIKGFEGDVNERGERSKINGWIVENLPWRKL
jgi:rhodanese-related sulfurtransferase